MPIKYICKKCGLQSPKPGNCPVDGTPLQKADI